MQQPVHIELYPHFFQSAERPLAELGGLSASTFVYPSGVCALRIRNQHGQMILLPFQGQQIWHVEQRGRTQTMVSMFDQPYPTRNYLETYGGFLLHCGVLGMGVPTDADTHPLHGELPNAPYQSAGLLIGEDEHGRYMALTGTYRHTVAFTANYIARPEVRLYEQHSRMAVSLEIENLKRTPMPLMYLAHINFRPVDHGRLEYSAQVSPKTVRVRGNIPSHVAPKAGYREFLERLALEPELHHHLEPALQFDPEVVLFVDYLAGADGVAHSLHIHPDGSADHVTHRPDQLPVGSRWITRTPDQDGLGFVMPATNEPNGYASEQAAGRVQQLGGGATWRCQYEIAVLEPTQTKVVSAQIRQIVAGSA